MSERAADPNPREDAGWAFFELVLDAVEADQRNPRDSNGALIIPQIGHAQIQIGETDGQR